MTILLYNSTERSIMIQENITRSFTIANVKINGEKKVSIKVHHENEELCFRDMDVVQVYFMCITKKN